MERNLFAMFGNLLSVTKTVTNLGQADFRIAKMRSCIELLGLCAVAHKVLFPTDRVWNACP